MNVAAVHVDQAVCFLFSFVLSTVFSSIEHYSFVIVSHENAGE